MSPTKTLVFFNATGDCAGFCLAVALTAGYTCTAIARTPSNLTASLKAKGVPASNLTNLTTIEGDARDPTAIKKTSSPPTTPSPKQSGMGSTPTLHRSLTRPVIPTDRTLCQDFGTLLLQISTELCKDLPTPTKPFLINLSTTGIPPKGMPRDVPLLLGPLYHWLLIDPYEDKLVFQQQLESHVQLPETQQGISGYVNTRASLIRDGPVHGVHAVREGVDEKPAVGYFIQRKDVGNWIFERLIEGDMRPEWRDKGVSITY